MLPVVSDLQQLLLRLAAQERAHRDALAQLEDRVRHFQDVDRPAYVQWRRVTLGPALTTLDELYATLRARRALAERVMDLIDRRHLRPREALYVATHGAPDADDSEERDAIDARRRAKRDRKRAERKAAQREKTRPATAPSPPRDDRLVALYRTLARALHPDSATAIETLSPERRRSIWDEVQAAYHARSVDRLLAVSAWLTSDAPDTGAAAERSTGRWHSLSGRYARLRALQRSCRALERQLAQLEREPAWGFTAQSARVRRTLQTSAAEDIEFERSGVQSALDGVEEFFASIGAPRRPTGARRR